ncbi:erythropoietin receptor-like [Chiloscyllium punctatum]|uniref:erythropoietin receptor-like n=1 Tax=Chiloscyllium punctatum TaxID=137246 RepID=UPI003B63343D
MIHHYCHLQTGFYFLVFMTAAALNARSLNLEDKMLLVTAAGPEPLNCFTQTLEDLYCFWNEMDDGDPSKYRFSYQYLYQDDNERKECHLSVQRIGGNMNRYICTLPTMDVSLFAPLEIEVSLNSSRVKQRLIIYINNAVVLDPPSNVTVQRTGKPGQLHVKWSAPQLKYLENSLLYEVNFSSVGSNMQKVETVKEKTECTILKLKPQTEYLVSVRAKPDGVSIDGYWTEWSKPVSAITDSDFDPLILTMSLVLVMIIMLLFLTILMTHRRMIKEKIWPLVPSPENMFDGLFTVYQGNFQEWLNWSSAQIWWNLQFFSTDEIASALEILSETKTFPLGLPAAKHQEGFLDERSCLVSGPNPFKPQQDKGLVGEGKPAAGAPEGPDTREVYVVLNQNFFAGRPSLPDTCSLVQSSNDVSDEGMPLTLLFEGSRPGSEDDKSSVGENSSGRDSISRQSSLSSRIELGTPEQQVAFHSDPSGQLLYLSPLRFKLESDRNYPYLLMSDSGISADFSTTDVPSHRNTASSYTNLYKREDLPKCLHTVHLES